MKRPEILTAAALAAAGLGLALWLAAHRVPPTPEPPGAPEAVAALPTLPGLPGRPIPETSAEIALPDAGLGVDGLPCGPVLSVGEGEPGFARVGVDAPCRAGEVVEILHGPIRFAARLSERGTLRVDVPRVAPDLGFATRLGEIRLDAPALPQGPMPVVSGVAWSPPLDLSVVAFEFGAAPGDAGHVTRRAPRGAGRVLRLGDPALGPVTELYIGPEGLGPGIVRLHVVARPRGGDCDGEIPIVAFEADGPRFVERKIRLRLDACEGSVLLKNLLDDLRIAGR